MPDTVQAPLKWEGDPEDHIWKVALIVDELLIGKSNNGFVVTLAPNATETNVSRARVSSESRVMLTPTSASAAAAFSGGSLWVETTRGEITVHHDSDAATDRTFDAIVVG